MRGAKVAGVPPHAFVVAAQNHDQVGNRAAGDRLAALVDEGRVKAAAALLLATPFTPLLFQGEEWAASTPFLYFTAHTDPALGKAVSEGRRREFAAFGWNPDGVPDPQDPGTFEQSKLKWDELGEPYHRRMLGWYRNPRARRPLQPKQASAGSIRPRNRRRDPVEPSLLLVRARQRGLHQHHRQRSVRFPICGAQPVFRVGQRPAPRNPIARNGHL